MRDALPSLGVPPERKAAVVDELAQLLEDFYAESGLEARQPSDDEVAAWARAEAPWEELAAAIRRQERPVASRLSASPRPPPAGSHRRKEGLPMSAWTYDLRFAWRMLVKNPWFSLAAVLTLAVAIGLNTSAFSIVNALVLNPLPVAEPESLARVYSSIPDAARAGFPYMPLSFPDFEDLRRESRSFTDLVGASPTFLTLDAGGEVEVVIGTLATGNYFSTLGLRAARGRTFTAAEDAPGGAAPVAVLSYQAWQSRFGGDPAVVGRTVRVNGQSLTILGVAPQGFSGLNYPLVPEMWIPMGLAPALNVLHSAAYNYGDDPEVPLLDDRGHRFVFTAGRLAPGVTPAQAEAELGTLAARLAESYPKTHEDTAFKVGPATRVPGDNEGFGPLSVMFMSIVSLVLLIAAANLANMLLARAVGRRKEIATRLALGAGRGRLLRQLLSESLLLALLGGAAGLLLAVASNHALSNLDSLTSYPGRLDLGLALDLEVVTFTLLVATLSAVVFGLDPARVALRFDLTAALHESSRGSASSRRLRNSMVIAQVALSVLLLLCAGLSMRSLSTAHEVDPGFDAAGVAVGRFLPDNRGYDPEQAAELFRRMEERLRHSPGVESVAFALRPPLSFSEVNVMAVHPMDRGEPPKNPPLVDVNMITPGYFETLRIPLLEGRDFTEHDTSSSSRVVIVSQALARRFWPGQPVLGQRLYVDDWRRPWTAEVVGVVADTKHRTLGESARSILYWPYAQDTFTWRMVLVRSGSPPAALALIRQVARELDEELAVTGLETLEETTERQALLVPRASARLFGLLGLIGLILATTGVYAVMAYSVSQRRHEIGVRVAMGAEPQQVVRLVLRRGVVLTVCGVGLGVVGSLVVTWMLPLFLYGIRAVDPVIFLAVPLALAAVALIASWIPARRAASIDPLETLRCE